MNKKLLFLTGLFTLHLTVASADRRPPYNNNSQRQNLLNLRVEEEKQKRILGVDKNGSAAWFANKVGKTTGFMYGLKARFTSVVLMTSENTEYHSNIFAKEQARRKNIINWAYPNLSAQDKNFKTIEEIAELAAWQGHCNAFGNNMNKLSFTLATEQKLKYIKSQESWLKKSALLKILEANY